jgi:hypothetical protein
MLLVDMNKGDISKIVLEKKNIIQNRLKEDIM